MLYVHAPLLTSSFYANYTHHHLVSTLLREAFFTVHCRRSLTFYYISYLSAPSAWEDHRTPTPSILIKVMFALRECDALD